MRTRSPKKHLSVRIPSDLEEFLRKKGSEHPGGFSGLVEDALTIGAVAHGYQPAAPSAAFIAFAETVSGMVIERMEEKGLLGKTQSDE